MYHQKLRQSLQKEILESLGEEWARWNMKEGQVTEGKEVFVILYPVVGMMLVPSSNTTIAEGCFSGEEG